MKRQLVLVILLAAASIGPAQEPAGERVVFRSADGVELVGRFHRSAKKRPCVLLLHGLGENRSSTIWRPFAERLNKDGYAVFRFDFRGHGRSTLVDADEFWAQAANRAGIRGGKGDEIQARDFSDRYWPVLINDIAAAKALLDRKNDQGDCNSANLILIGTNAAATLGAVWLRAECFRYRQHPAPFFGAAPQTEASPQAQHVLCALWLNLEPKLGAHTIALEKTLEPAARRQRLPMAFLYDDDSAAHKRTAHALERAFKNPRLPYTGAVQIAAGGDERGENLLLRHYPYRQIQDYLKNVADDQGDEWQDFDSRQAQYIWRSPRLPALAPANRIGDNRLFFQTYEAFLAH